jgi:hypothetical protein
MSKKFQSLLSIGLIAFFLSGCSTRIGDFTVISTQNVDFGEVDAADASEARVVEGEDIKFFGEPNLEEAIDDALNRGGGNVMIDAVLYIYTGFLQKGYKVKGRVINAR